MRTLVTGGTGFIGTHLCRHLTVAGYQVVSLDIRPPSRPVEGVEYVLGDTRDDRLVGRVMRETQQTYHLAAVVGFANVMLDMRRTIETNTLGTETVLHYALVTHQPVLLTSTSACYGRGKPGQKVSEDDDGLLGPTWKTSWAYAYAKACDEALAFSYLREFGLPVVVARLFNTVGAGQSADAGFVLPRFVGQALRGEPLTVHTPGTQTRTFCHVTDTVRALMLLMQNTKARGELVNVGGTETYSMLDLATKVNAVLGTQSPLDMIEAPYDKVNYDNVRDRAPDLWKLYQLTGYVPRESMETMILDVAKDYAEAKA